ncbi:hypothetical protein [Nonomuraea sp. NPDC050202]|uniref:hypothetical protein n=1 Tax=Nonomuraea sp. NPDC050202 TaxID=3155035 RepID=UPI00340A2A31
MMPPPTDTRTPSTAVLVPAQRTACQPWCVTHDHVEGVCTAADVATPGGQWSGFGHISMSHGPTGGTLLTLTHDPDAELTPDEFEQLCLVGLAQVALARCDVVPSAEVVTR